MNTNIIKYGIYSFLDHFRLIWMINTLYVLWLHFPYTTIGIFEMIFALTIVVFELPTGALADLIGRKKTLMVGSLFNALGFFGIGFTQLPYHYYFMAILLGVGFSFTSGADIALLFEILKKDKKEKDFKKVKGKITTFNQVAIALGVIFGPLLFSFNPRLNFIVTGFSYILAFLILKTIDESPSRTSFTLKEHWEQTRKGISFTLNNQKVRWLILAFFFMTVGIEFFNEFWQQPLLISHHVAIPSFSYLFLFLLAIQGIVAWHTHRLEKIITHYSFYLIFIIQYLALLFMASPSFLMMLLGFFLFYAIMGFQEVVFEDVINQNIPSKMRATILSVKSLFYNLITSPLYVLAGVFMDIIPLQRMIIYTVLFLIVGVFLLFLGKPKRIP